MSGACCDSGAAAPRLDDPRVAIVQRGSLADMQRAEGLLAAEGIEAVVVAESDPGGGGCCGKTFHVAVAREDAPRAAAVFHQDWRKGLTDEQVAALEALAAVEVDPDGSEMTCPACLTTFAAGPAACPDCGLAVL